MIYILIGSLAAALVGFLLFLVGSHRRLAHEDQLEFDDYRPLEPDGWEEFGDGFLPPPGEVPNGDINEPATGNRPTNRVVT